MNVVAHNLTAMNGARQYKLVNKAKSKSAEKLSSGYKINRAADDAAGLSISEKMRQQIRGLEQGVENIADGISYAQVADGALNEVHDILQRMNELAVQSANGTNSENDRQALDGEMQQLKTEMERIFVSTKFNEKQVWPDREVFKTSVLVDRIQVQGVAIRTPSTQRIKIENKNYGKVPCDGYDIHADAGGITVSWKDYDGMDHVTKPIDWATFEANGYSMNIGDYLDPADTEMFDPATGKPLIDFQIACSVLPEATTADIIKAIDGTRMPYENNVYMSGNFEDATGATVRNGMDVVNTKIYYSTAYASYKNEPATGYNFDQSSDGVITPTLGSATTGNLTSIPAGNTTDVSVAENSTDKWSFKFNMEGIGEVTATSSDIKYCSYDYADYRPDERGLWWDTRIVEEETQYLALWYRPYGHGNGTLGSLMEALTGSADSGSPGILNSTQGGIARSGGCIDIEFDMISQNPFTYAGTETSKFVGKYALRLYVSNTDTKADVLAKINQALNTATILDFATTTTDVANANHTVKKSSANTALVNQDVYEIQETYGGPGVNVAIHSGASTRDKIPMEYHTLRLNELALTDTNIQTEENSEQAIRDVADAIQMISEQRSLFGSYQNRMEHALAIAENVAENTTAAESRIRDTDMAEEMVEYSKNNILAQAGQSMLAQANQSTQGILSLLG